MLMPEPVQVSQSFSGETSYKGNATKKLPLPDKHTIRILFLHDQVAFRESLASMLASIGEFTIVTHDASSDTEKASTSFHWKFPAGFYPDILLTDFALEEKNPFELARQAKSEFQGLRIVFLASRCSDGNLEKGLMVGATGFIARSESVEGIAKAIRIVQAGEMFVSESIKHRLSLRHSYDPGRHTYIPRKALLSRREVDVLCCVAKGLKAKTIGKNLHITTKTVERHKSNIMAKLGLHSQVDLAVYAIREGYVTI